MLKMLLQLSRRKHPTRRDKKHLGLSLSGFIEYVEVDIRAQCYQQSLHYRKVLRHRETIGLPASFPARTHSDRKQTPYNSHNSPNLALQYSHTHLASGDLYSNCNGVFHDSNIFSIFTYISHYSRQLQLPSY